MFCAYVQKADAQALELRAWTRAYLQSQDAIQLLEVQGLAPDPWQREVLSAKEPYVLLNCSRQAGKSTTVAALALHRVLVRRGSLVLLVAPSERQSKELYRKIRAGFRALGRTVDAVQLNQTMLELANGSRIVALPGREGTIRSFSGVDLLVIDEAARVPDDLYRAVRPMLAVSRGRLVALSTPFGQRGWFYQEWQGAGPWHKLEAPWTLCPRIDPAFIAEEVRALGQAWVDQEYGCRFTALTGLVYPDFHLACADETPPAEGRLVGGIDFGWRDPFAAVWGVLDKDDVLWIVGERYASQTPLCEHAAALPKDVMWHADPSGRTEREELIRRNLRVRAADNSLRSGIAKVTARLRTGHLKVLPACKHLMAEAQLYRYGRPEEGGKGSENPIDADNHALDALRYLVAEVDSRPRVTGKAEAPPQKVPSRDEAHWIPR